MHVTKRLDLGLLSSELTAAAVPHLGLGLDGTDQDGDLYSYDETGTRTDLPPAAVPVVNAHVAPAIPAKANYGADATDIDRQAAQATTQLRAFIANASPTNAEVVAAVKLNARAILALMRRAGL